MLRLDLASIARQTGLKSVAVFLRGKGFSEKQTRTLSKPTTAQLIRDRTLQRLCEAFVCTPNDLFRWHGDRESHLLGLNMVSSVPAASSLGELSQEKVELLLAEVEKLSIEPRTDEPMPEGRLFLNVKRMVEQRQARSEVKFLQMKGFTESEARKLLDPERKAVKMSMLTRLCNAFMCLPNDLYDWEGSEEHPLNALRKEPAVDLNALLLRLPPDEVRRILEKLGRI